MEHPLVLLPLLFGAFALYGGTYHLVYYLINRIHKEDLLFSGACLGYFCFNGFNAMIYGAQDPAHAAYWQNLAFSASIITLTLIYLFTYFFFRMKSRLLLTAIGFGLLGVGLSAMPDAIDLNRPAFKTIFGHEVFESARHPFVDMALAYEFVLLLLIAGYLFRSWRGRGKSRALNFFITYCLLAAVFLNDVFFLSGMYLAEYGVVFLLGTMSLNMALREKEMRHFQERTARLIVESQNEFQENLRQQQGVLASEVEKRTRELVELNRESRAAFTEIDKLNEFSREINSMTGMDEVLDRILNYITNNFGITSFWLLNIDHKHEEFTTSRVSDFLSIIPEESLKAINHFHAPLAPETGLLYKTYQRKRPLYLRKLQPARMSATDQWMVATLNLKGLLLVPLTIQGEVKAIACFTNYEGDLHLSRPDIRRITRFCEQIAGAVNSAALIQEVESEREKSDRLLRNVLPDEIAEELKEKGEVRPVFFESASVLFSDLVGFTRISKQKSAQEIISDLNAIFLLFDRIADQHDLEKIKTIGDAYMAAGGIPRSNRSHPVDVCLAALEIIATMKLMQGMHAQLGGDFFQIRLGIHTGPLMAGVVGKNKFAYDIFGDSVNVASRMESGGMPGRINISEDTYKIVSPFFDCEYRGELNVKNRGRLHEYFLNRIRPELSRDPEGIEPNEKFHALFEALKTGQTITNLNKRGLTLQEENLDGLAILKLKGEVNLEQAGPLADRLEAILASGCKNTVIDMGSVSFIDSTGVGTLINAHRKYLEKSGRIVIVNLPEKIAAIFQGLGVSLYDKLAEALAELNSGIRRSKFPEDLDFNINFQQREGAVILRLAGKLNYESARILRERLEALIEGAIPLVVLNLKDLKSIDSSGFGAILQGHNQFGEKGGSIRLVQLPAGIAELFTLSRLESVLHIFPDEETALQDESVGNGTVSNGV